MVLSANRTDVYSAYCAFFKSNFTQYENKTIDNRTKRSKFVFVSIDWLVSSSSSSPRAILCFTLLFSFAISLSGVSITAQQLCRSVHIDWEGKKYHIKCLAYWRAANSQPRPDQTISHSSNDKPANERTNNVENVDLWTASRFITD